MNNLTKHIVYKTNSVREVLTKIDELGADGILFLVDDNRRLLGTLTDGDIRRGLIKGHNLDNKIEDFIHHDPKFITQDNFSIDLLQEWRKDDYKIVPIVDEEKKIVDIINFRLQKSKLPIDAVIMAGGKGTRLHPLTLDTPKPLLKVGEKPIIEHNVDRLRKFGIKNITISIRYLGQQLIDYFGSGDSKNININYVKEEEPLGTIGALSLINEFYNDYVLVMNSDLLTNIDYEDMFKELVNKEGDMIVATTPYKVKIPYGVTELDGDKIISLKEKPTYTYYSNAGIYIFKRKHVNLIPKNNHFNATDLMERLYTNNKNVINYPILGYWLDIGKPVDFKKAQEDINHIHF